MATYRIRVEQIDGDREDLGRLGSPDGIECTGFIIMCLDKDEMGSYVTIKDVSPVNMAMMFGKDNVLNAAAKAGEALNGIVRANDRDNLLEKLFESDDDEDDDE